MLGGSVRKLWEDLLKTSTQTSRTQGGERVSEWGEDCGKPRESIKFLWERLLSKKPQVNEHISAKRDGRQDPEEEDKRG